MTLTFVTNFVNHHQLPLADEFYKHLGNDYHYIATEELPDWLIKGGYDPALKRPYIIRSYQSSEKLVNARRLIDESDVVILGSSPLEWSVERKKANKLTFHFSERWLKKYSYHSFTPKALWRIYANFFRFRNSNLYLLCASAFAAKDVHFFGCFPNRCYKWGYMTAVDENYKLPLAKAFQGKVTLMWCSRFLAWKHPELPVKLASLLKKEGYQFELDMYGSGEELDIINALITELGVDDVVNLCGNLPNPEILSEMRRHDIFLFTSDRNEGWGAVLNEAMNNGCSVVASDMIGSAPYLINNGKNGLLFNSIDLESLYSKVKLLIDDDNLRRIISENAIKTMQEIWNPRVAAERFLHLSERLLIGLDTVYTDGPCSKAFPINNI